MEAFMMSDSFTMDSKRHIGKNLLCIKASSQSSIFVQLVNIILGLKKLSHIQNL
jgi:hypothetical protein